MKDLRKKIYEILNEGKKTKEEKARTGWVRFPMSVLVQTKRPTFVGLSFEWSG